MNRRRNPEYTTMLDKWLRVGTLLMVIGALTIAFLLYGYFTN